MVVFSLGASASPAAQGACQRLIHGPCPRASLSPWATTIQALIHLANFWNLSSALDLKFCLPHICPIDRS